MLRYLHFTAVCCTVVGFAGCGETPAPQAGRSATADEQAEHELELPPGESLARFGEESETPSEEVAADVPVPVAEALPETPPEQPAEQATGLQPPESMPNSEAGRTGPAVGGPVPAAAVAIIDEMTAFYGQFESLHVRSEVKTEVVDDRGRALPNSTAPAQVREVVIQRPNRFAVRPGIASLPIVASDGEQLSAYLPTTSKYLRLPAPATLSAVSGDAEMAQLLTTSPTQWIPFFLLSADSGLQSLPGIATAELLAREPLEGVPADRLMFEQEGGAVWNLWVAAEGDPLLLRASLNRGSRKIPVPGRGETEITIVVIETLSGWELNPDLTDDDFAIAIAADAREVQDVAELLSRNVDADQ